MTSQVFRYQTFVAVLGNPGGEVPVSDDAFSSPEQQEYTTTSKEENSDF